MSVLAYLRKVNDKNGRSFEGFELLVEQRNLGKVHKLAFISKEDLSLFRNTLKSPAYSGEIVSINLNRFKHPTVHPSNSVVLSLNIKAYLELYKQICEISK